MRKPAFLIILAAALIIAGIWAYISNRQNQSKNAASSPTTSSSSSTATTANISNLTNLDSNSVTDDVNTQLALADSKAAEVDKKLQLCAIEIDLPGTLDRGSGSTYYVYSSPNDKVNNWVIAFSNSDNKFVRSRTLKDDYMTGATTINRTFLKTNYVAALQVAEKNGGKDFRQGSGITALKLTLKNAGPKSWLYWFVDYSAQTNTKSFQIDASNGVIVTNSSAQ